MDNNDGTRLVLGATALLAGAGIILRAHQKPQGSRAQLVPEDGRWYPFFYGSRHGTWEEHKKPIMGFRREGLDWALEASMSSRNNWRNWMVTGATERDPGLREALTSIVRKYPEAAEFDLKFDGPWMKVGEFLNHEIQQQIEFLHGTSTKAWENIQRQGLRPRRQHGGPAAYGAHIERALQSDEGAVYLTTQIGTARFAARDAARVTNSAPIILSIRGINITRLEADEDSRLPITAWRRSLETLGSVKYRDPIPPELISVHRETHE